MNEQDSIFRSLSPSRLSVEARKFTAHLESTYASPASKYTITGDGSKWQYFGALNRLVSSGKAWDRVEHGKCQSSLMSVDPHLADCILLDRMLPLVPKGPSVWSKLSMTHRINDSQVKAVHWDGAHAVNCRLQIRGTPVSQSQSPDESKSVDVEPSSTPIVESSPSRPRRGRRASESCLSRCRYYPDPAFPFTHSSTQTSHATVAATSRAFLPSLPLPLVPVAGGVPQPVTSRTLPPLTTSTAPLAPLPAGLARIVNYFSECKQLTNKTTMAKHLCAHARKHLRRPCPPYMPDTYVITHRADDETELLQAQLDADAAAGMPGVWICKGDARAKGDGIVISSDPARILAAVQSGRWVVQRYVDNPLTVRGRKFDVRVWVLVAPWRCAYVCSEAVLRLTSVQYQRFQEGEADVFAHLTNHCIQAQHAEYGNVQAGNEMFLAEFAAYLSQTRAPYTLERFYTQLNEVVRGALAAVAPMLFTRPSASSLGHVQRRHPGLLDALAERYSRALGTDIRASDLADGGAGAGSLSFQLLGFDVMLTDDYRMQLLEVNATPAAAEALLERVVRDATAIALAPFECGDVLPRYAAAEGCSPGTSGAQSSAQPEWRIRGGAAVPGASLGNVFYPLPL